MFAQGLTPRRRICHSWLGSEKPSRAEPTVCGVYGLEADRLSRELLQ